MKSSLQFQVLLLLTILVAISALLVIFTRQSQISLQVSNTEVQQAVQLNDLVHGLERNVLDLQRVVLIYGEAGNASVVTRFQQSVAETVLVMDQLESHVLVASSATYTDRVQRMRGHLDDFQINFEGVVEGRSRQSSLFYEQLLPGFEALRLRLEATDQNTQRVLTQRYLAYAERAVYRYLRDPTFPNINTFNLELATAREKAESISRFEANQFSDQFETLARDFVLLTQVTRGYVYLVNVVMAGSANEFLFLSQEMRELVQGQLQETQQSNVLGSQNIAASILIASIMSIFMIITIATFLIYRMIFPVRDITRVFQTLTMGGAIHVVPGINRVDEVGELAKAANVFHAKNLQTEKLLEDATELNKAQKRLNHQLTAAKQSAEAATVSKSLFLANMSHEIRTPMNGILGLLRMVRKTELTPRQQDYIEKIGYSSNVLLDVINDILDFSKIEAGKLKIESVSFELDSIVQRVVSNVYVRAEEKKLYARTWIDPRLKKHYLGDPLRLTQILLNLCSNAMKFTERGGVSFELKLGENDTVEFHVLDTGIGMSAAELERIFESFTQADGSTSRKFGGTGLGLAIVKQLVELMGGRISVSSQVGKGTAFCVSLPLTPDSDERLFGGLGSDTSVSYYLAGELNMPRDYVNIIDSLDGAAPGDSELLILYFNSVDKLLAEESRIKQLGQSNVGFILDIHPAELPGLVREKFGLPILMQPLTLKSLSEFFLVVTDKQADGELLQPVAESVEQQFEGHVLLVEDNVINQVVAGEMLGDLGLTFDVVDDGRQAVERITKCSNYDLVLMDIQMPVLDGYEATRELRRLGYADLKICGLSANAMEGDVERAIESGMNDYLTKPIAWEELETTLSKYLRSGQQIQNIAH